MTDTPNARLARVLRLLADVAERGRMSYAAQLALEYASNHADERRNDTEAGIENQLILAESYATESARLAGVPVDGWYTSEPPKGVMCLVTSRNGFLYVGKFDGSSWSVENFLDLWPSDILAWRPLVEPYRPEEKTDEQR